MRRGGGRGERRSGHRGLGERPRPRPAARKRENPGGDRAASRSECAGRILVGGPLSRQAPPKSATPVGAFFQSALRAERENPEGGWAASRNECAGRIPVGRALSRQAPPKSATPVGAFFQSALRAERENPGSDAVRCAQAGRRGIGSERCGRHQIMTADIMDKNGFRSIDFSAHVASCGFVPNGAPAKPQVGGQPSLRLPGTSWRRCRIDRLFVHDLVGQQYEEAFDAASPPRRSRRP